MPGVWILWSKKIVIIFQKGNENAFTLLIIFIVKSLQKEIKAQITQYDPCRNKPAITPKWFNSLYTNSNARHQVIKDSIVTGRTLLDDNTAIKMAMEATEKALVDLQKERPKRDAEGNLIRGIKGQLNSE